MIIRKHVLTSLITLFGIFGLMAQNPVEVYGVVTNSNGSAQENVEIFVSAFFADSSFFQEVVLTGSNGGYSSLIPNPNPEVLGFVQIDMIDCNNNVVTQFFTIANGVPAQIEANFTYCSNPPMDTCFAYILVEPNPGSNLYLLTALTFPGFPASYMWSNGDSSQTILPTESGDYCVTVTVPGLGCVASDCVNINLDSVGFCFGYIVSSLNPDSSSYTLEVVASGVAPFEYAWSTGQVSPQIVVTEPGSYCVVVIDATGCAYTTCIIVDNVSFCEAYIAENPNGGLIANGFGLPPMQYLWNTGETTQSIFPAFEGLFCVTVTDANGCEASTCYDYWFPMDTCFVFVSAFLQDSNVFTLQAVYTNNSGGPFNYLWSTGETTYSIQPSDPFETYCVTVTDASGCVAFACYDPNNWCYSWINLQFIDTTTASLTAVTDPIFNWPGLPDPIYAWSNGDTTETTTVTESGTYCVTVTLGTGCETEACYYVDFESVTTECSAFVFAYPDSSGNQWYAEVYPWGWGEFTYLWHTGDTTSVIPLSFPQAYACVTVTSSLGCETVACLDSLFGPCHPIITALHEEDQAILVATAFNIPSQNATFTWSTGEVGETITVTETGNYCVTVTGGGCTGTECVFIDLNPIQGCGVSVTQYDTIGGTIFFANAWGTPPFTYLWDTGETSPVLWIDFGSLEHCVTITDGAGCTSVGCNYMLDSCYAEILLEYTPEPQLFLYTYDPVWYVNWSTGVADSSLWLDIDEPGTYCAYFTTINGCVDTVCITIDSLFPGTPSSLISGYVFTDTTLTVQGNVYAYLFTSNTGEVFKEAGSSTIGADGFYQIGGLQPGLYVVKADFNDPQSADHFIPTYHHQASTWDKATPIVIPNWLTVTQDIHLIHQQANSGGGVIGGKLIDPQHLTAEVGEEHREGAGLGNHVILLHNQEGQPIDFIRTQEDGSYRFTDLAYGTYRLKFDIAGIPTPEVWVTISPSEPEKLQINLLIEGSVAVDELHTTALTLYPNPARESVMMSVEGDARAYSMQIVDMQGRVIYTGSANPDRGILTIDTRDYPHGLYHVNLTSADRLYYGRFVKQE